MPSTLRDFSLWSSLTLCWVVFSCNQIPTTAHHLQGVALGTTYNIRFASSVSEQTLQKEIDSLLYVLNRSLSTYLPQSDISKINRGDTTVVVDAHFVAVFEKATEVWKATDGYFDPTVGALVNAYGFGPEKAINALTPQQKDSLLALTGWQKIQLQNDRTLRKESPNIYIDFNALAKGYVVDMIGNHLYRRGILNHLVEIGGEIVAKGNSPKTSKPWKIAIDDPRQGAQRNFLQTRYLRDRAMASSGNYRKYRVDPISGQRYVHSINPLSGSAQKTNVLSTSVIAPDCMTADAWATALMVMPLEKGKALIENIPHLEALWTLAEKDDFSVVESKKW